MRKRSIGPKRRWPILAALAVVTVVAVALALSRGGSHPTTSADQFPNETSVPTTFSSLGASASPASLPSASGHGAGGALGAPGQFNMPGLNGNGFTSGMSAHTVVMRAWSSSPIPALGWIVPTAKVGGKSFGKLKEWSRTVTAYGSPKYAELYLSSDYRGISVSCSISIDGVVRTTRHSAGPYGNVMCMA